MPTAPHTRLLGHGSPFLSLDPASRRLIYDNLAPTDLHSLSQASFALDTDIAGYWAHLVKALCSRYTPEPDQLLAVMDLFRAVFSGSAVLALVSRAAWKPGDLDIYCGAESFLGLVYHFGIVQGFLLENPEVLEIDELGEYHVATTAIEDDYLDTRQILSVAHMRRGDVEVDIVQSASSSALSPLGAFWTTAVQNFISPSMICVAYPALTEAKLALLAPRYLVDLQLPTPRIVELIRKYEARHFRFASRPYALTDATTCNGISSSDCPASVRFFGDEHSLVIMTRGVAERAAGAASRALLEEDNVFWWRGGYTCGLECGAIGMRIWPGMLVPVRDVAEISD